MIADPVIPVPPAGYGGVERMVDVLSRCLAAQGHQVHLIAGTASKDYGGGVTFHYPPKNDFRSRAARKIWFQCLSLRRALSVDLVINHGRLDYLEAIYRTRRPLICWFHNPLSGLEVPFVSQRRERGVRFVAVSHSHASYDPAAERFDVLLNAVDTKAIPFSPTPAGKPYLLFLGRLTRNKGVHLAIAAARRAGMRLVIAGNITKEAGEDVYFEQEVRPHFGPECEWVGPYNDEQKSRLVAGARALLFPIQWREPCALVVLESLAAGTPVVAMRFASTPEVVEDGKTGFLCDTVEEMVGAINRVDSIQRSVCRADAEERFSLPAYSRRVAALIARTMAGQPPLGRELPAGRLVSP